MEDNPTTGDGALTIDELAQRVGMTVRNLREWRALGLLPPAEKRGRVGYYDPALVGRIERMKELHAEGFTLDLIRRLLEAGGELGDEAMRLAGALRAPFRDDDRPLVEPPELARRWGATEAAQVRRAIELGLIRQRDDGRLEFTSARIAKVGDALHRLGLSVDEALDATAEIRAHADGVAELFERVWRQYVWEPWIEAGTPAEQLADIERTVAEVQPLALDAVVGIFTVAMEARIEAGIAHELERAIDDEDAGDDDDRRPSG